jgi:hypothetical protein
LIAAGKVAAPRHTCCHPQPTMAGLDLGLGRDIDDGQRVDDPEPHEDQEHQIGRRGREYPADTVRVNRSSRRVD